MNKQIAAIAASEVWRSADPVEVLKSSMTR
jgi:hypothetical protein